MDKQKEILEKIEASNPILIYRHVYPDWDARGSQMGLYHFLKENYPDKDVFVMGESREEFEKPTDEQVENGLAIVLDTSTSARIDGEDFARAKDSIRVDHHVFSEEVANLEWIEDRASATCELLARLFKDQEKEISKEAAQFLYQGLIADNVNFSIETVTPETFLAGAYLISQGANPVEANLAVFGNSIYDFGYENKIRSSAHRKENFLYAVMNANDYLNEGLSFGRAKEKVFVLSNIKQIECWALFTMNEDGTTYSASLRSRTIEVRDLAERYGGGGHRCAAGIKTLTIAQLSELITLMAERSIPVEEEVIGEQEQSE